MALDKTLEKYNKLPIIRNGKEVESIPITEEDVKEHQIKFAKIFYENMKEHLKEGIAKYEKIPVIFYE